MKKYEFKYEEWEDLEDDYRDELDELDERGTTEQDGNVLMVSNFRIVIPALKASIREANWFIHDLSKEADEEWSYQAGGYVRYPENETDIDKFESFTSGYLSYCVHDICNEIGYPEDQIGGLDCYIDVDENID